MNVKQIFEEMIIALVWDGMKIVAFYVFVSLHTLLISWLYLCALMLLAQIDYVGMQEWYAVCQINPVFQLRRRYDGAAGVKASISTDDFVFAV
ncbi:hypothetical protein EYC80_007177 [Monilinia laxa]|uniref:Uncharacterized protein n=1 Tax=Monilinia laxa TaxID=61186 RepID=A0A5N6K0G6_MONLA|nr:hypothetical protein EYC80_007177 [Monilinia laxa]